MHRADFPRSCMSAVRSDLDRITKGLSGELVYNFCAVQRRLHTTLSSDKLFNSHKMIEVGREHLSPKWHRRQIPLRNLTWLWPECMHTFLLGINMLTSIFWWDYFYCLGLLGGEGCFFSLLHLLGEWLLSQKRFVTAQKTQRSVRNNLKHTCSTLIFRYLNYYD